MPILIGMNFNSQLACLARQYRGKTQKALAAETGLSQGLLSKLEKGNISPSPEASNALIAALGFPVSFFYQPDKVYGLPLSVHPMFRKGSSLGAKKLEGIMAAINIRLIHIRRFLTAHTQVSAPQYPLPSLNTCTPAQAAARLRALWRIPSGPLLGLTQYVEQLGCLVIKCAFHNAPIDGVTLRLPDLPPCIFLNENTPADRLRFTLAHELGHVVLHSAPCAEMEQQANDFAAALLMPADQIKPVLMQHQRLNLYRLAALKPDWRVSIAALLVRAQTLEVISANQAKYLWQQMSAAGLRKREPPELDFAQEPTFSFEALVKRYLSGYTDDWARLSEALCMYEAEVRGLYGGV